MSLRIRELGIGAIMMALLPILILVWAPLVSTKSDLPSPDAQFSLKNVSAFSFFPKERPAVPVRIRIPDIRVDAPIEQTGLAKDGAMETPTGWDNVGWYDLGKRPGEEGTAVFAGHLDSKTGPAVFWNLKKVGTGTSIITVGADGNERRFIVTEVRTFDTKDAPMNELFGPNTHTRIALLTCAGSWSETQGAYVKRRAVFAEEVP